MKMIYSDKYASVHWSAAGTKSGRRPTDDRLYTPRQPLVLFRHRCAWGFLCPCFRRYVQDSFFDAPAGKGGGCFLGDSTRRRPFLPGAVPPRRSAVRRPAPTHPSYFRVLGSTNRFAWGFGCPRFRGVIQDRCPRRPGGQEGRSFPARTEPSASRLAQPRPNPPHCHAPPCPDLPVIFPSFGFDKFVFQRYQKNKLNNSRTCLA